MLPIEQLQNLIQGKKVAFIGAGVSTSAASNSLWSWARRSRSAIRKSPLRILARMRTRCAACMSA